MCGATLAALRRRGAAVRVVAVTSGAASGQGLAAGDVAATRRRELLRAAAALGVDDVVFWELPDRGLTAARGELAERVGAELDGYAPTDVYVPFPSDAHDDHVATALALGDALGRRSGRPDDGPCVHGGFVGPAPDPLWVDRVVPASATDWRAKLAAVHAYGSRDASIFVKPLQFAYLAPGHLMRPAEQFVDLGAAAFAAVCEALAAGGLTRPAGEVATHPLYVARERAQAAGQRREIAAVLAAVR